MMSMKPTPYIAAKSTARDAIVTFGAGYGFLLEPFEWRVTEYLQNDYLYAIGGEDADGRCLSAPQRTKLIFRQLFLKAIRRSKTNLSSCFCFFWYQQEIFFEII